jgi:hypothetical protein
VNNLEQNFDQAKKLQVRANIGIPTSVNQTDKVLGVTAATGELGWIPQSGGSRLYVPESWLTISGSSASVASDHLDEVAAFLGAHSDILATVFLKSSESLSSLGVVALLSVQYRNTASVVLTQEITPFSHTSLSSPTITGGNLSGAVQNLVQSHINLESDTPVSINVYCQAGQYTAYASAVLLDALT